MRKKRLYKNLLISFIIIIIIVIIYLLKSIIWNNDQIDNIYLPNSSYILTSEQINSKISGESEALNLLRDWGLGDNYILKNTFDLYGGNVYHFQETVEGIPVHGRYSNVITSKDTTVEAISSNYYPIQMDTTPKIKNEEALNIFLQIGNFDKTISSELCVYGYDENPRLSYCIRYGCNTVYIDANTGEIIQIYDNLNFIECVLSGYLGEVEVDVKQIENQYELFDASRGGGIEICTLPEASNGIFDFVSKDRVRVLITPNNLQESKTSVDALYNLERVYDYYVNVHQFYSTDGKDQREIHVVNNIDGYKIINSEGEVEIRSFKSNAAATTMINEEGIAETWFIISSINENAENLYSYYLDVMAHEYTHAVMYSIIGNAINGQMGAMGEAYADIIGECCEAYYRQEIDWVMTGVRNVEQIANGIDQGSFINHMDQYNDDLSAHDASTVISSAAYYMYLGIDANGNYDSQYAIHSYDILSKLWFTSMFYLTPSSDFITCRYAVENAAALMIKNGMISRRQADGVSNAFDKVGINGNDIMEEHGDILTASPNFELKIKDRDNKDYEDCEISIKRIYQGRNYQQGHNLGIAYRNEESKNIFTGSFAEYKQNEIIYEEAIYEIELKNHYSFQEESFKFYIKKNGPNALILHTSFVGNEFDPFSSQSDNETINESEDMRGGFVLENPFPEGYQMVTTPIDSLFSGHFANMSAPMGLETGGTYKGNKLFATKGTYDMDDPVNGAYYLIISDVMGNVYDLIPLTRYPKDTTGWIKNDVFYYSGSQPACIMNQSGDITDNFFSDEKLLEDIVNDDNGIMFITSDLILHNPHIGIDDTTDTKYDIWNDSGEILLSFYKNEIAQKYSIDPWASTESFHLKNLGNGIYHISNQKDNKVNVSPIYLFIDINRKKVFAVPVYADSEYDSIESDGNYIMIPHKQNEAVTMFDIETETVSYIENISNAHGLGEGKFFTDQYCCDVAGNILYTFNSFDTGIEVQEVSAYNNGQAIIIFDRGKYYQSSIHEYQIGLINENGAIINNLGTFDSRDIFLQYIPDSDIYMIFATNCTTIGLIFQKNSFQTYSVYSSSNADRYYGIVAGGQQFILRYGCLGMDYSDEISPTPVYGYELLEVE